MVGEVRRKEMWGGEGGGVEGMGQAIVTIFHYSQCLDSITENCIG